ncbi:FHA domain-containing protein [Georgenia ruanii]|uniref:FHA domain-containing protein n=1 Tax=Georgenia ruanii TaxID=348442 RepID=UPI001264B96E|nr:FHA domain-containing protein [Georgenia ruanii]
MIGHEYRPGNWIALVAEGAVALLHPMLGDRAARELWEIARRGARVGDRVGHLAARAAAELPAFAVVEADPRGLRVLVRGDVVVTAGSAQVTGAGPATTREALLPGEARFVLAAASTMPDAGPDTAWLPLVGGMVHAAQVRAFDTAQERPLGLHRHDRDPDVDLGIMHAPVRSDLDDTAIEMADDDADLTWASEPDPPAAHDLPVEDGAPGPVEPRRDTAAGVLATPAASMASAVSEVLAAPRHAAASGAPHTPPGARAAEPLLELVLPTGARVPVTGPVRLGRAPEPGRVPGAEVPRLVAVPNPERGVSTTHAEVRPAGDYVVVTDLGSTNGTVLHLPGRPPRRLRPGTGVPVPPGGVVELGAEVSIGVERVGLT